MGSYYAQLTTPGLVIGLHPSHDNILTERKKEDNFYISKTLTEHHFTPLSLSGDCIVPSMTLHTLEAKLII